MRGGAAEMDGAEAPKRKRGKSMPQMNKGGKFIFGESVIRQDGRVQFPPQAVEEYRIAGEGVSVYRKQGYGRVLCDEAGTASALEAGAYSDRNAGTSALRSPRRYVPPL